MLLAALEDVAAGITDRLTTMDGERGVYTPVASQAARATG